MTESAFPKALFPVSYTMRALDVVLAGGEDADNEGMLVDILIKRRRFG